MGWLHSCTSKAQSARQDNCCAAVQPSHAVASFLRKSARMVSSSFFSEKKTRSFEADLQRTQRGPQPRLQAFAVLSKTAKGLARESNALASAEEIKIRSAQAMLLRPAGKDLRLQEKRKSTHPNTCRPPRQPTRSRALPVQNFRWNALPN